MFIEEFFLVLIPAAISSWYKYEKSSLVSYAPSASALVTFPNFFDCSIKDMKYFESWEWSSIISRPIIYFDFTSTAT